MAVIDFPNVVSDVQNFGIRYNTQISSSELSGVVQTVELPGARWAGSLNFIDMTKTESADLKAFLLELRGSAGRFYFSDQIHTSPFVTVTGSPTVGGTSTRRVIRVTLGSGNFSEGDYIQIGTDEDRELKMVIDSALVGGTTYDLTIEPMIRRETFIGQSVVYTNPKGKFMLSTSDQASWASRSKALLSDITIDFVEAF